WIGQRRRIAPQIATTRPPKLAAACYTRSVTPARVAFVSPSGLGNLGDAAIIESLVAGIRRRRPGAEIVGFTLNPDDTRVRQGVEAAPCGPYPCPTSGVRRGPQKAPASEVPASEDPPPRSPLRRAVAAMPGARKGRRAVVMAIAELRHRREVARRIAGFD